MLFRPMSHAWLAGAASCLIPLGPGPARADMFYETGFVPTGSVLALPGSSFLATSYVVPSAYTTTYLPTSSVVSSGEVLTSSSSYFPAYRSIRFRPRRYFERTSYLASPRFVMEPTSYLTSTSYLSPTSYLVPTTFASTSYLSPTSYLIDSSLITTSASSACCETALAAPGRSTTVRPASPAGPGGGTTITSEPANPGGPAPERRPSGTVEDGTPSYVNPPVPAAAGAPRSTAPPRAASPLVEPDPITPPPPTTPPAPAGSGGADVQVPGPGQLGPRTQAEETSLRKSQRPTYEVRNVLRGKVVGFDSGRPEEGVSVILSSRTSGFADRPALTDADGEFKVSLPDGDWTVKVKMPSGVVFPVGRDSLTASNGRIVDVLGRNVKEFLITR